jgi:hypothetical protein
LVSETIVVDKKDTTVGWVFDFFVIPICSDYLEKKNRMKEPFGSGYLKIFRIKRITGLGYFIKTNKITESLKNRSGKCEGSARGGEGGGIDGLESRSEKCEGPAGGDRQVREPEWEMRRIGRGGSTG